MVYCGKASLSCQNCRTRRIRCDKARPECSQCVRVGKTCSGYRDQLSLMFRDESSKVMQRVRAQWTAPEGETFTEHSASPSMLVTSSRAGSASPPSASMAPLSPFAGGHHDLPAEWPPLPAPALDAVTSQSVAPNSDSSLSPAGLGSSHATSPVVLPLTLPVGPSLAEQGIQFYINRYLLGHPDEPRNENDLHRAPWLWHPALQDIMAAVGLAGLANLSGRLDMMLMARTKYGSAIGQMARLISAPENPTPMVTMRSVVLLALFEVVRGNHQRTGDATKHILGGAALVKSWSPLPGTPFGGFKALLQLCYSMFIPAQARNETLPPTFFDWIAFCGYLSHPSDKPAIDLATLMGRYIQLNAFLGNRVMSDGRQKTANAVRQVLDLDADLATWEAKLEGKWLFRTMPAPHLPSRAIFDGEYHSYFDVWVARVWNHYRWTRLLVNEALIDMVDRYPTSSLSLVSAVRRERSLDTIRRLARDTLLSTPTHWRHPVLDEASRVATQTSGGGGGGAAGIPVLLYQLKVAACAPGIPIEYWDWVLDNMQCVWGDMGMLHAYSMMESMRAHRGVVQKSEAEGILAPELD